MAVRRRRWPLPARVRRRRRADGDLSGWPSRCATTHPDRPPTKDAPPAARWSARTCCSRPRRRVRVPARPAAGGGPGRRAMPPQRCWPVLVGRRGRRLVLGVADHPATTTRGRPARARRAVRLDRDRRDPHAAGDDDDRRGEGRGPRHRPAGRGDHRPLRRDVRRGRAAACTASSATADAAGRRCPGGTRAPTRVSTRRRRRPSSTASRAQGQPGARAPARRADAQDLFFAGQSPGSPPCCPTSTAVTHVAVVLADDPAADLHDWYGRYWYFAPDELEPLDREESRS